MFKWASLEPQSSDELVQLDIDIIEDLFEAAGISLSDADAQKCLDNISSSVLGRHSYADVVGWYRDFMKKSAVSVPHWRHVARNIGHFWDSTKNLVKKYRQSLWKQLAVISEVSRSADLVTLHADIDASVDTRPFRFSSEINAKAVSTMPVAAGFSKIQAWHRNQLLKPASLLLVNAKFGIPESIIIPDIPDKNGKVKLKAPPITPDATKKEKTKDIQVISK